MGVFIARFEKHEYDWYTMTFSLRSKQLIPQFKVLTRYLRSIVQ